MNVKEQKRLLVLNRINEGKLTGEQAAELFGWSVRHVRRTMARYREEGARALAHGNRGRSSERQIPQGPRSRIVSLARGRYAGVNQQHLVELLAEREHIDVSRSTLRRFCPTSGTLPQEGMRVQIDGSRHGYWLAKGVAPVSGVLYNARKLPRTRKGGGMSLKVVAALGSAAAALVLMTACRATETGTETDTATEAMPGPTEITLDVERIVPESIDSTQAGTIFVGNVIGNSVYRVPAGTTDTEEFIPGGSNGLERVLGVYADEAHGLLWVCSTGSMPPAVASFDIDTGEPAGRYNLPAENPTVCNDIAVSSTGNVYIGETTGGGVVWMAPGGDRLEYLVQDPLLASADGVALLDDRTLIVNGVQTGRLVRVDLDENGGFAGMTDLTLSHELEGPDGMRTLGPNQLILAENRAGRMTLATIDGDNVELQTLKEGLEGTPAVTATRGMGWIIEGQFNLMQDEEAEPRPFILYGVPLP